MKITKLIIISFLLISPTFAQNAQLMQIFENANKQYSESKFREASVLYDSLINSDYESAELYYNAGNSCYRLNKVTDAIYFYEKALLLNPGDEALAHNLELANLQIYDRIKPVPEFILKSIYKEILKSQTASFWAYASVFLFFIVLGAIYLYLVSGTTQIRLISFIAGLILLVFSTTTFIFAQQRTAEFNSSNTAIIFAPAVSVKSEPNANSSELFMIHEGLKVNIIDYTDTWLEIKLASGMTGWVNKKVLKRL